MKVHALDPIVVAIVFLMKNHACVCIKIRPVKRLFGDKSMRFLKVIVLMISFSVMNISLLAAPIPKLETNYSKDQIIENFKLALLKIEQYYLHSSGDCIIVNSIVDRKKAKELFKRDDHPEERFEFSQTLSFSIDDDNVWFEAITEDTRIKNAQVGVVKTFCKNAAYSFILHKKGIYSDYVLDGISSPSAQNSDFSRKIFRYLRSPFSIENERIIDFLNDGSVIIDDVIRCDYLGKVCFKINFSIPVVKRRRVFSRGFIIVSPGDGWLVLRKVCDIYMDNKKQFWNGCLDQILDYDYNSVPSASLNNVDEYMYAYHFTYTFKNLNHQPHNENYYSLKRFGLPEIGVKAESVNRYGPLVSFFIIGAILVFVGFVVFYLARKASRSRNNT